MKIWIDSIHIKPCPLFIVAVSSNGPEILHQISTERRLLGNSADSVSRVRDPASFFPALRKLGVPFPETRFQSPGNNGVWLQKFAGGSGGFEVTLAEPGCSSANPWTYFQKLLTGKVVTATILASEFKTDVVGISEQWCTPTLHSSFTYGGAVALAIQAIPRILMKSMQSAAERLCSYFELKGLLTLDSIIADAEWYLLEVNPRPGYTFELHEGEQSFVTAHWQAFNGVHEDLVSITESNIFRGHFIVYATSDFRLPADWVWPDWVQDVPTAGESFSPGSPVCTVYAESTRSDYVKSMLLARHETITNQLQSLSKTR